MFKQRGLGSLLVIGLMLLAVACTAPTQTPTPAILRATETPLPLTRTPEATVTLVPNTTPTQVALASTPTSGIHVIQECLNIETAVAVPFESATDDGVAILLPFEFPKYLLDLGTGEQHPLPYPEGDDILLTSVDVSADAKYLAYVVSIRDQDGEATKQLFWVVTGDGTVQISHDFPLEWGGFFWLDNQWLQVFVRDAPSGTWVIYNVFTDERRELPPALPDLYTDYYQGIAASDWTVQYSPDLEWAVYLTNPGPVPDNYSRVVIWDIAKQQAVWERQGNSVAYHPPKWSSSREFVAAVIDGTIYVLNRTGLVAKLAGQPELEQVQSVSWSPNERYLAYWTELPDASSVPGEAHLYVYDRQARAITDFCLGSADYSHFRSDAVWSPDSERFFIRGTIVQADGTEFAQPILIDMAAGTAVQISANQLSEFWLRLAR